MKRKGERAGSKLESTGPHKSEGECFKKEAVFWIKNEGFINRKAMEDISFYKNISDDCFYLSPKEGDLEKEMATHSNILAWRIPWTEKPGGLQSMGSIWPQSKELDTTEWLTHTHTRKETMFQKQDLGTL